MKIGFDITKKMKQVYNAANPLNELPIELFGIPIYQNNYRNYLEWLSLPWGGDCWEDEYNESIRYADYLIEERNRRDTLKKTLERIIQEHLANKEKGIVPPKKVYTKKEPFPSKEPAKVTKLW